jgi:N-acetyl sugar amidotransferase
MIAWSRLDTNYRVCSRCIYDERVASISFDEAGVCNYCHQIDSLIDEYGTGRPEGKARLEQTVEDIKRTGHGKRYDCVIGVSGGTDSSYMVYLAKEWGLRPLAVHYDNTWNSAIATQNIHKVLKALDVDLFTWVVNNKEADDIFRAFFLAGVPELEASTDLAYAEVLQYAAHKAGVKYILEGHTFVNEGITPLGKNYFDGRYIKEIHRRYGRMGMKTYPLMTFNHMLYWSAIARIKKVRPFWYLEYSKEEARDFLTREYGWEYYGGHHLENRMTAFLHGVYLPEKFGADMRNNTLAALARQGKISREEAWLEYTGPRHIEEELVAYVKKRLDLGGGLYEKLMAAPPRMWTEYPTYKKRFEDLRWLFKILADQELVPRSFYMKYCFPIKYQDKA